MPSSYGLSHRRISALLGLHKAVSSPQGQGFIPRAMPYVFPSLKHPPYTPIMHHSSCLPDIQTFSSSSPSRYQSISSAAYPLSDYQHTPTFTLLAMLSFTILSTWPNHRRTSSPIFSSAPFITLHNCLFHSFGTLSILLIPNRPQRSSISTALILGLSFSLHIVSLPTILKNRHQLWLVQDPSTLKL